MVTSYDRPASLRTVILRESVEVVAGGVTGFAAGVADAVTAATSASGLGNFALGAALPATGIAGAGAEANAESNSASVTTPAGASGLGSVFCLAACFGAASFARQSFFYFVVFFV